MDYFRPDTGIIPGVLAMKTLRLIRQLGLSGLLGLCCQYLLIAAVPVVAAENCITIDELESSPGSGCFYLPVDDQSSSAIQLFYHLPASYDSDSRILVVVPGAGRNADDYRDSWVAIAEHYGVLVLSPVYPENAYDFAAYHLGGIVSDLVFRGDTDPDPSVFRLADEDISYTVNNDESEWLFRQFDRIFLEVSSALKSNQSTYDLFGHSAGGQILHRYALFSDNPLADTIIAANAGLYTQVDWEIITPFGLRDSAIDEAWLTTALSRQLVVLLGELDNRAETRGTMLHTPLVDSHGLGRLERGQYFFQGAETEAAGLDVEINWKLEIVPGVGHDFREMGAAAAELLYAN